MYDITRVSSKGFMDTLTSDERNAMLDFLNEQRYSEFEGNAPVLSQRGAPIGFDDTTDPIGREFGEFYSTPSGYHPNSAYQETQFKLRYKFLLLGLHSTEAAILQIHHF